MKIKRKHSYSAKPLSIAEATVMACQDDRSDRINQIEASLEVSAELVGRLLQKLSDKGLLSNRDVLDVLGGSFTEVED